MGKGGGARVPTSMDWANPRGNRPAPPESWRYSFFQMTIGEIVSLTSTGTLRTPLGKAVADRPSRPGRAPVPPAWKLMMVKGVALTVSAGAPPPRPAPPPPPPRPHPPPPPPRPPP